MRGCFRLWHQEPKGLQRTQSGSGATSVRPGLFHSFRHSFIDALRVANVGDEIKHALLGWSGAHSSKVRREGQSRTVSTQAR